MALEVTPQDIREAALLVNRHAHRTPVLRSRSLDARAGCRVHLKCENFQRVGAFKFRGAVNALSRLTGEQRARGVVTHSSGNHAQAVALAARELGARATVVMPRGSPAVKVRATKGYGARVVECENTQESREKTAAEIVERTGATLIHPYDHPHIIAGQGTAALELLEQAPGVDVILAPVGGGGLCSGTAVVVSGHSGAVSVIGCEPEGADDARRSLETGTRVTRQTPRTIADGLRTVLGELPFRILRELGVRVVTVSDRQIIEAMRFIFERMKMVIEPSSAVPIAALFAGGLVEPEARVGVIVSGGNADLAGFFSLLEGEAR